jgi:putative SOS response-associated peptidase YedK
MPVILTRKNEIETWLTADWKAAKALQRPLPDDGLTIVARGETTTEQGGLFG